MLVEWANNRNIGLTDGSRWFVQPSGYLIMDWEYILPKCIASCSTSADPWWNSVRMNHGYAGLHVRIGHVICPVHHGRVVMATRFSVFKIPRAPMPCMRCTPPPPKKKATVNSRCREAFKSLCIRFDQPAPILRRFSAASISLFNY